MLQAFVHYSLHFLFPGMLARLFFPQRWLRVWGILLATMLVDADHLLADPVFDPQRCSIGFHPLHSYPAIAAYALAFVLAPKVRLVAGGLLLHMLTDYQDCLW
jgi:hypothetical protein